MHKSPYQSTFFIMILVVCLLAFLINRDIERKSTIKNSEICKEHNGVDYVERARGSKYMNAVCKDGVILSSKGFY